eukprot:353045-Chlamydomonas_euryale.AAC.8
MPTIGIASGWRVGVCEGWQEEGAGLAKVYRDAMDDARGEMWMVAEAGLGAHHWALAQMLHDIARACPASHCRCESVGGGVPLPPRSSN